MAMGFSSAVVVLAIAFHSLGGSVPELDVPEPTPGARPGEEELGPACIRPTTPSSLFSWLSNPDAGS